MFVLTAWLLHVFKLKPDGFTAFKKNTDTLFIGTIDSGTSDSSACFCLYSSWNGRRSQVLQCLVEDPF